MALFHLEYPESKTFFKWDEMGCLCRALGFPSGLFQTQMDLVKDEIHQEEDGISMKTLQRVWDLKVMFKWLHHTFNMHTADWNTCTFVNALYLLSHRALSFQDLHNIRVGYCAYEHMDMKGMLLDKHTLLRTLKMCGRTIAPLKLMHRIKHMKGTFEEKGRIQLYEFFNLILWCDMYTSYSPEDMETSSGKEEELFRLVDFHRLLSHHDERMSRKLDATYLKEEWDFGMECLGPRELFKEPVVNTDARVAQAHYHQTKYRHLKQEIGQSQKRVYRAHAGTVRSRPVSAPDFDDYRRVESALTRGSTTATQVYESVQRRLHSAPSGESATPKLERPMLPEHRRAQTPQVVTPRDLTDVRLKMDNLNFDINTLGVRCELQVEKEMDFYIPGYMEKVANRKPDPIPVPEPEKKPLHWTSKIVNNLAYPKAASKPSHNKSCDARHRGWQKVTKRSGTHLIVTSQAHPNTEHGKLFSKMEQTAMDPVQYLHPDYVIRYTPKSALPAPSSTGSPTSSANKSKKKSPAPIPNFDFKSLKNNSNKHDEDDNAVHENETRNEVNQYKPKTVSKPKVDLDYFHSKYPSAESALTQPAENNNNKQLPSKASFPVGLSQKENDIERNVLQPQPKIPNGANVQAISASNGSQSCNPDVMSSPDVPVPFMEHSRPKIVGVGQIGTISLLESIQESRDLEERFVEEVMKRSGREGKHEGINDVNDSVDDNSDEENDDIDDAEQLSKSLKLNLQSDVKSQPSRRVKPPGKNVTVAKRKTRSAPSISSMLKRSPRKISSPQKLKRGLKSSSSTGRCRSAGDKQGVTRQSSGTSDNNTPDDACSGTFTSSYGYEYGTTGSSSDSALQKFQEARGSVTSEEAEVNCDGSKGTMTTRRMLTGSCRVEEGGDSPDKMLSFSRNDHPDEVESFYSDAMTLPSSSGMTELESPTVRRCSGFHDVPDISVDLEESLQSGSPGKRLLDKKGLGHRVQFVDSGGGGGAGGDGSRGLLSPMDLRNGMVTSLSEERRDSFKIMTDYRDYLSDSGLNTNSNNDSSKRVFSKETRDRLINRVKSSISPDLRMLLLANGGGAGGSGDGGGGSNRKISIPAT